MLDYGYQGNSEIEDQKIKGYDSYEEEDDVEEVQPRGVFTITDEYVVQINDDMEDRGEELLGHL